MSRAVVILLVAGAAWAQSARKAAPVKPVSAQLVTPATVKSAPLGEPAAAATTAPRESKSQRVPLTVLDSLKKMFDGRLQAYDSNFPIDLLGITQAVYLSGYGTIFSTEVCPSVAAPLSPFHQKITEQEVKQVHQRMLDRMPAIRKLMTDMLSKSAEGLVLMPEDQAVVVAVRFSYLPWEDRKDLPEQITMKAARRTILMHGQIETDEQ